MNKAFPDPDKNIPLNHLEVLAADCQATGANPDRGHVLEIGYLAGSAAQPIDDSAVRTHLIRQPMGSDVPPSVLKLTGISQADLECGIAALDAWGMLLHVAHRVAACNHSTRCPTIIHYARFEASFLIALHRLNDPDSPLPLDIICTHSIAERLLPGLPRKGIRALAGYFGHPVPVLKRSHDHVVATMAIWRHLVGMLCKHVGVSTYDQLSDWLAHTPSPNRGQRVFPMPAAVRKTLPDQPGIYRMRGLRGDLLYIGKAKSLNKRVTSYFRTKAAHPEHILEMLTQALDIDFTQTDSALEAAIMEADEIKRHRPPYNKALQSNQRSLVFIGRDLARKAPYSDQQLCIGPLPDGRVVDALMATGAWLTNRKVLHDETLFKIGAAIVGRPPERLPEVQCIKEGFDLFYNIHKSDLQDRTPLRIVTVLGAKLWRDRSNAMAAIDLEAEIRHEGEDGTEPGLKAAENDDGWTPDKFAGASEGVMVHSAHLIRRARWYCLISESSVAWAAEEDPHKLKHQLVFEHGQVCDRATLQADHTAAAPFSPSGSGRSWTERRNNLDLAAYDRMRVVTTELRRLVGKGRKIQLCLGPKVRLAWSELEKALRWV